MLMSGQPHSGSKDDLVTGSSAVLKGATAAGKPRLFLLITEDSYFWTHRLDLARAARDAGMDVHIVTRVRDHGSRITPTKALHSFPFRLYGAAGSPLVNSWPCSNWRDCIVG